jgi:tetratricopeptide (TPR) repeat protein
MKSVLASVTLCALLLAAGCSQSPEKLLATGNKYRANKKYDEASILYQKVLVKDKTNAEAYYLLGLNYLDQGKIAEAAQALRRAIDLKPSNTDAEIKLAEIYLAAYASEPVRFKGMLPDINDLDNKILQQNPNSFDGLRLEGLIALIAQNVPKAMDCFAKANRVKPYSPDLVSVYAEALIQTGKPDDGIALIKDTLVHNKTWDRGYDFLFVQYARAGQKDKAEAVLRQHVDAQPTSAVALVNYANYRLATGDYAGGEQLMRRMLSDPKSFPNARMLLGDFYLRAKKPDLALASYQQGEKDDSKNGVRYEERIVELKAATKHLDEALTLAKEMVDKNPKDASAAELYAVLLLQTSTGASAPKMLTEIKKMSDNNPANSVLHLDLGKAYFGTNDRDKALAEAQRAITDEQKSGRPRPAVVLPAQILVARIYSDKGENGKALEQAQLVLNARPGEPDATIIKDRALIASPQADKGDIEKARTDLEGLLQRFPKMSEAHLQLGSVYLREHMFDKAIEQYQAVENTTPGDNRGFIGVQTVKLVSGHSAEAIQAIQDLLSKNPSDLSVRFELANFEASAAGIPANQAKAKDLTQQATDNYKEILKTSATSSDIWLRLGVLQRQLGQSDASLASFEQAGNTNPKSRDAFLNQAQLLEALGRRKEAFDAYNKVLGIDPDNWLALNNLAFMSAESGSNLNQAQTYAERAKKEKPNSPQVADTLGYVYLQKNLNTQAAEIFRQNVTAFPENADFRFHLAMALLKQGDKQGAKQEASKALQSANPDLQSKIKAFVGQIG